MVAYFGQQMQAAARARIVLKGQIEKIREILRYPNERECPVGMY